MVCLLVKVMQAAALRVLTGTCNTSCRDLAQVWEADTCCPLVTFAEAAATTGINAATCATKPSVEAQRGAALHPQRPHQHALLPVRVVSRLHHVAGVRGRHGHSPGAAHTCSTPRRARRAEAGGQRHYACHAC